MPGFDFDRAAAEVAARWSKSDVPFGHVTVGDPAVQRILDQSLRTLYQAREQINGVGQFNSSFTLYRGLWAHDAIYSIDLASSLGDFARARETLDTIATVHTILEKQAGVGNVWSLETLRRWLAEKAGATDVSTLKEYVSVIPEHLVRRFISADQDAVVVSGRVPDLDSSEILPVIDKLDAALNKVRTEHPGFEIAVTGLSAIAARNSANMIQKLNRGLTIEFALVAIFIGLAFRSVVVMFSCILPGIFPVVLSGTVLWLLGQGLQFASVVALTVSFGLGLSATIHFLNRLRLEMKPGVSPELAVERATVLVGPALILTTVVLACGLVVTVFSDLPSLRLFGWLSAFAMVAALVADLFILRPTAMFLINLSQKLRGTAGHAKPAE